MIEAFPGTEEKSPAAAQWSAERCAKLIPVQWILRTSEFIGEEVRRIQHSVAKELEDRAVESVASASGDDVDLRAGAPAEFRLDAAGLDRELLYSVGDAEKVQRLVGLCVGIADAVQQVNIRLRTHSIDAEARTLRTGWRSDAARNEHRKIEKLAPIQRNGGDHMARHGPFASCRVAIDARGRGFHVDDLADGTDLEMDIHAGNLIHLDGGSGCLHGSKTIRPDFDLISTRLHRGEEELACGVCERDVRLSTGCRTCADEGA